ncbi:MAG: diaminopimelate decarboxylase [Agarilytica sp.]
MSATPLTFEQVSLESVADAHGTPCYVYSKAAIVDAYHAYTDALGDHPGKVCYAVKANSNLAILQVLASLGAHFDIVSAGEMARVIRAGGQADHIIFSGVGKTPAEMEDALTLGIACFNIESEAELYALSRIADQMGKTANISLRVNPDVDAKTHPYISTGLKENKFGVAIEQAPSIYQIASSLPGINIVGVDCHIGSQLTETAPFLDALDRLLLLIDELNEKGIEIHHLDLGGGLGVVYHDETPPAVADYIGQIKSRLGDRKIPLMFEPGRSIVANAGAMITEVLYLKPGEHKNFAIVDAAMNDNIRPSLYQAWQQILPLCPAANDVETKVWDVVGPVCETGDFFGKDRELTLSAGDRLALMSSGAYGFTMSSNYNTRCRAAEVLIDGDTFHLVRERETFEDLIRGEKLLPTEGSN